MLIRACACLCIRVRTRPSSGDYHHLPANRSTPCCCTYTPRRGCCQTFCSIVAARRRSKLANGTPRSPWPVLLASRTSITTTLPSASPDLTQLDGLRFYLFPWWIGFGTAFETQATVSHRRLPVPAMRYSAGVPPAHRFSNHQPPHNGENIQGHLLLMQGTIRAA